MQAIVNHAPNNGKMKQKDHVPQFTLQLVDLLQRVFGRDVVLVTIGIKKNLDKDLFKQILKQSKKGPRVEEGKMIKWKSENSILLDILGKDVDTEHWEDAEKLFYKDQKYMTRIIIIDKVHVDIDHESRILVAEQQRIDEEMEIEEFACDGENMMNSTLASEELNVNTSLSHSGLLRFTRSTSEIDTQTEWNDNLHEGSRNFKDSIKIALAASNAAANISPHHSRIAFKVTSEKSFGAQYHLSADVASLEPKFKTQQSNSKHIKMCSLL